MQTVEVAFEKTIPKSTYKCNYQLTITPEVTQLERAFNSLKKTQK